MKAPTEGKLKQQYETHLKHLRLKGLQPKTIEAYARAIRRIGGSWVRVNIRSTPPH